MKTQYELDFEELVAALILSNNDPSCNQLDLFMDFHRNSRDYYDLLCDALYTLSSKETDCSLWITPSGRTYLQRQQQAEEDLMLLTQDQIPDFEEDLHEQLQLALHQLQTLVFRLAQFKQIL